MPRYCEICERNIEPQKKFNWIAFLVLFLTGIGPIFYVFYYFIFKRKRCPICNGRQFDTAINFRKARQSKRKGK